MASFHGVSLLESPIAVASPLSNQEARGSGSSPKKRTYIQREREEAEQRLFDDYFGDKYLEEDFRQRCNPKYPTLILEAVADQKLWIWHAYFGVSRENIDLNVLYGFTLFDDLLADKAPEAPL
nr:hypothetical protein [Tanacetum cinerariifolium]